MPLNPAPPAEYRQQLLSNGITVMYTDEGHGDTVLLFLHGLATYSGTWVRNTAVLNRCARCIALDLPGNGYSEKGKFPFSMEFYAACVYDFIRLLGLRNVVLCGHSMGGQVAMTLVLRAPEIVSRLILCAPAGFEEFSPLERTMYRSAIGFFDFFSSDESSLRSSIYSSFYKNPAQAEGLLHEMTEILRAYPQTLYRRMLEASIDGMLKEPVYPRLQELTLPVLVIFGAFDALIPNKLLHPIATDQLARQAIARMPDARLEMIPFAGHFVQWEKADEVNQLIAAFLG